MPTFPFSMSLLKFSIKVKTFILTEFNITVFTSQISDKKNIAVFSEKTDAPHLPNQSMVAISVMKL